LRRLDGLDMKLSGMSLDCVLLLLPLLVPFLHAGKKTAMKHPYLVYVGTYTGPKSKGIYVFDFDETGHPTSPRLAAETVNPSFLAVDPTEHFLYAVNEISDYDHQKSGAVSSFAIDRNTGALEFLNQVSSRGADPCHITLDETGKYVLVANYTSGTLAVFPRMPDGKLAEASSVVQHTGHGPNPERQEGPHAHEIVLTKDNRFAIAADLGLDRLLVYRFDAALGTLAPNDPPFAEVDPGSGPRHLAFTPNGRFVYVLAEMGSTITAFAFDTTKGSLRKFQAVSTLPGGFKGQNDAAEIAVHPSGKFAYASNRGDDTIVVFAIGSDGRLSFVERTPTKGKTPRGFAIDPTGSYLLAANQASDNLAVFAIDRSTGRLGPTNKLLDVPAPVDVTFVRAE
jgi:6-phosphogluconolactonase